MSNELDQLIRQADEDRWLASRFAPADARARLIALYAVNHEIARVAETVKEPAIGDIRLAWWREALAEAHAGAPRPHPVLLAYAQAHSATPFTPADMDALIAARAADLERAPFATLDALVAYVDATAGGLMRLALDACAVERTPTLLALTQAASRGWGVTGLLRAAPFWRDHSRALFPEGVDAFRLADFAKSSYSEAKALADAAPAAAFAAIGYAALVPLYLRALARNGAVALLRRQITLIAASATGRL